MTCVRDWFQIHQQALHTKLFTEAKACVPCYRWHGHAGPGPAQWGLASGAARTQWLITMPCTAVGPLRQHGGQVTTPLPQQLLLSLWQRKGQTLLFFLGHYPVPRSLTQAAPRCRNAPGRLVAQTLLLPDPDPSPWGGGRGGSQETLPPGEACDAKPPPEAAHFPGTDHLRSLPVLHRSVLWRTCRQRGKVISSSLENLQNIIFDIFVNKWYPSENEKKLWHV